MLPGFLSVAGRLHWARAACLALLAVLLIAGAGSADQPLSSESRLQAAGIEPSQVGVRRYLESLLDPELEKLADKLIAQLADPDYETRERATRLLSNIAFLPVEKLEAAGRSPDAELAFRAKTLARAGQLQESPLAAALALVEEKQLAVGVPLLLEIRKRTTSPRVQEAATRAMLAIVKDSDLAAAKELLKHPELAMRNVARRLVARLENPNAAPLLEGTFDAVQLKPGHVAGGGPNLVCGWEFKPKRDLTVTHLGIYDHRSNGLSAPHEIAIWDVENSKAPVALETALEGKTAPLAGVFRFVPVERSELKAGRRYAIVAHYRDTSDATVSMVNSAGMSVEFAAHLEIGGRRYSFPHPKMAFPAELTPGADNASLGPTFRFEVTSEGR